MGESTLAVRQSYVEARVLPVEDLPDHIANELQFLAYLSLREYGAPDEEASASARLREQFRQEHVLEWIGDLRDKIAERERLGFYLAAIKVAEAVVQSDA